MAHGKYTYGKIQTYYWDDENQLVVGNFCSIAHGVVAFLGGNHRSDWVTTYPFGHGHKDVFNNLDITKTSPAKKKEELLLVTMFGLREM
jgi:acetyltransferase-like isoleucine patch superfamily enzyme